MAVSEPHKAYLYIWQFLNLTRHISIYGSFWTSQANKANCRHMCTFRLVLCLCNCSQHSKKMI